MYGYLNDMIVMEKMFEERSKYLEKGILKVNESKSTVEAEDLLYVPD